MSTTQTQLFAPTFLKGIVSPTWLLSLQMLLPLRLVDTTAGGYAEDLPPAGLNATTGQSNQNQEIIYEKVSGDANTFTLNGAIDGPHTLTTQYEVLRFKSNGTDWYPVCCGSGGGGGSGVALYGDGCSTPPQGMQADEGTLGGGGTLTVTICPAFYNAGWQYAAVATLLTGASGSKVTAAVNSGNSITFSGTAGDSFFYIIFPFAPLS